VDAFIEYNLEEGILNHPPGITIMGVRYHLSGETVSAIAHDEVSWGWIVVPEGIATAELRPRTSKHLDWMDYGAKTISIPASSVVSLVGQGDQGYRSCRAARKVGGPEENLVFVVNSRNTGLTVCVEWSVGFKLP